LPTRTRLLVCCTGYMPWLTM